ncbi:MAG: basic amino acid/polyamine antiporter [Victivallaceae bacterium]|nr:basic amino acid/polyamine antiporter [Victivallaceae bacterium]
MADDNKKLGVIALAALVVSAMIGGGIFSLPQNMAQDASVVAVIVAWVVTGIGMFFIANTFRTLADARPDATTGIYAYARLGFGRFAGFQMAWAYWLCNIFGNVGYAVLLMDAFNYFFPGTFAGGNNLWSIVGGSLVIWIMNFAVLAGVRQAAFVNVIGTICKLLPIALFILIMLFAFRWMFFTTDMFGTETIPHLEIKPLGGMLGQVKSTMLVTLWAFIGIEGAVVVSGRAKSQKAVGMATLIGFLGCLVIYFLLSVLPFGRMYQPQLAGLANPSTAPLLQDVVHGEWGGVLMNLGVIVALLTSWLAFTIMVAQIPFAAAMDGTFPRVFRAENRSGTPTVSLWVTSTVMQLTMILVFFANNAWNTMLSVTSVMILPPYLACTLYLWKLCEKNEYPEKLPVGKAMAFLCGVAGSLYAVWMIYAAGVQYLLMAFCFLAIGIPVYVWARHDAKKAATVDKSDKSDDGRLFTPAEGIGAVVVIAVAVAAVILFATDKVSL